MGPLCLYFGCWNEPGHYLVAPGGGRPLLPNDELYLLQRELDGAFAPRRGVNVNLFWEHQRSVHKQLEWELRSSEEYPQGRFLRHRHGKWTLIQWWDRCQGDTRGGSSSTILLQGEHDTPRMLEALSAHFPEVLDNLTRAGIQLVEVEVFPSGDPP